MDLWIFEIFEKFRLQMQCFSLVIKDVLEDVYLRSQLLRNIILIRYILGHSVNTASSESELRKEEIT